MDKAIVKNHQQAQLLIDSLDYSEPLEISIKPYDPKRTIDQNALTHAWYNEIDKYLALPVGDTKCQCKLYFGVPILRAENEEFREGYDRLIKHRMTQEEKLELMRWFPVTSLMSKKQLSRYADSIQHYYATQYGIVLD
jgi:hypothetical protein